MSNWQSKILALYYSKYKAWNLKFMPTLPIVPLHSHRLKIHWVKFEMIKRSWRLLREGGDTFVPPFVDFGRNTASLYLKLGKSSIIVKYAVTVIHFKEYILRLFLTTHCCLEKTFGLTFLPRRYIQCILMDVIYGMIWDHFWIFWFTSLWNDSMEVRDLCCVGYLLRFEKDKFQF